MNLLFKWIYMFTAAVGLNLPAAVAATPRGKLLGVKRLSGKNALIIASLFLALNFDAVIQAKDNRAIPSIGGQYFESRVEIPVPAFAQDDPRWSDVRLGPSTDTLGDEGVCGDFSCNGRRILRDQNRPAAAECFSDQNGRIHQ